MNQGIYEELVTQLISTKLNELDKDNFIYKLSNLDKAEAATFLSKHIAATVHKALNLINGEYAIELLTPD